jgi:hypothetical protein
VARLRSNQVFVVGDVKQPGSYRISSAGTALTALYAAGGPTDRGSMRRIEVRRRGAAARTFDVYSDLVRGDASGDVRLENGDVLFCAAARRNACARRRPAPGHVRTALRNSSTISSRRPAGLPMTRHSAPSASNALCRPRSGRVKAMIALSSTSLGRAP